MHIAAEPDTVFAYFIDPARYVQWMGTDATIEPVPGGMYRVYMRDGIETAGQFVEVDPPRRIVFTWGWTYDVDVPPGSTRVEITFGAEDGGTRVVLRHHDLPSPEQRTHHGAGWQMYLSRLATRATGEDPGPDPNAVEGPLMQIPRPTVEDKEIFQALAPERPDVAVKPMFGNLGAFVNGNMFMGLYGSSIGLKLAEDDRVELAAIDGAGPFGPDERPMGGYVAMPAAWRETPELARPWVERALEHVATLPAKKPKKS
jgi:uncharacterized protein YndB with AHSA1/START domain/TfoX/Sxy family transcriptional regulator of competence genes